MHNPALITGASSGIGLDFANIFAANGHDLILVARRRQKLEQLARDLETRHNIRVRVESHDLSQESERITLHQNLQQDGIVIRYLVNNAGLGYLGQFTESSWEKQRLMLDVNIQALTHLTHLFLPQLMQQHDAHILNLASTASFQPGPNFAVYCATKAYVLSFSEAIGEELRHSSVRVTALCPGPTETELLDSANLRGAKGLKSIRIPTSRQVAEFGYKAMTRNKKVVIYGALNWIGANAARFVPRTMVTRIAAKALEK